MPHHLTAAAQRHVAIPLAACLLALGLVGAAQVTPGTTTDVGASAQSLVAAAFKPNDPGATVIVVKDGKPLYRGAVGMASLELGVPLQPDSVLRIGSVTKQFTSAAVMMLVEQGKVALEDEITKFFPDYPSQGKHITVQHLLTHTSGIKSYTGIPAWRSLWRKDFTATELIDFFKSEPMDFEPGEQWRYNNSAYFLLGALIEKSSGVSYAEFVSTHIFTPLGMRRTRYGDTDTVLAGRVPGYARNGSTLINAPYLSMTQPGAAGALLSTVDDLATWDAAVSAGKLLTPASWQRIFSPYRLANGKFTGYGFGWQIGTFEGHRVYEHGGGIHGFSAYVIRLPEDRVYVAVLSNCGNTDTGKLARKLAALAAGKPLVEPQPVSLAPVALTPFAGVYLFDDVKVVMKAGDTLVVQPPDGAAPSTLVPMGGDAFFVRDSFSRFTFERDPAGKVIAVTRKSWSAVDRGTRIE